MSSAARVVVAHSTEFTSKRMELKSTQTYTHTHTHIHKNTPKHTQSTRKAQIHVTHMQLLYMSIRDATKRTEETLYVPHLRMVPELNMAKSALVASRITSAMRLPMLLSRLQSKPKQHQFKADGQLVDAQGAYGGAFANITTSGDNPGLVGLLHTRQLFQLRQHGACNIHELCKTHTAETQRHVEALAQEAAQGLVVPWSR